MTTKLVSNHHFDGGTAAVFRERPLRLVQYKLQKSFQTRVMSEKTLITAEREEKTLVRKMKAFDRIFAGENSQVIW